MTLALLSCLCATTLLTACTQGSPEAGHPNTAPPSPSAGASSSAPTNGSSSPPTVSSPTAAPTRPTQAAGSTLAAGEAFIGYYVELLNYAYTTGDPAPLMAASDEGCEGCKGIANYVRKINAKNGGLKGDYADHLINVKEIYRGETGRLGGSAALKGGAYVERSSPGASPASQKSSTGVMEFSLSASGGNWVMFEMQINES
ncbi:DUF6318 family protein [Kribbella sindirgiensis]|nr:DUF6318 family protein [Kribbella sindirgiensis]